MSDLKTESVSEGYERRVVAIIDRYIPEHGPECDEAWTSGACLRCDIRASLQVAFGFARPLPVSPADTTPEGGETE